MAAAVDLVDEEGLPGLTMDALAARAGASKATLYRRWPDRLALAVALLDLLDAQHREVPATGSTHADLAAVVRARDEGLQGPVGALLLGLAAEARRRPDLAEHVHRHTDAERARIRSVLTRGVDRGDLRDDADLDLLEATVFAAGLDRAWLTSPPLTRSEAIGLAERLLRAAREV
jgi:AcrR family transcriptional regulator